MNGIRRRWGGVTVGSVLVLGGSPAAADDEKAYPTIGSIERSDPRIDRLGPRHATMQRLAEGFDWAEGPAWDRSGGYRLFSDVPRNTVFKWKEGGRPATSSTPAAAPARGSPTAASPARTAWCSTRAADSSSAGTATAASPGSRPRAGSPLSPTATGASGSTAPTTPCSRPTATSIFTDPPYGLRGRDEDPKKELPFNGVYRLAKDGTVTLLTREMTFPNGLAFAPDEETLYVANSDPNRAIWRAFDVRGDGTLGEGRVFCDATPRVPSQKGLPDGMKVDRAGNLFATGPGGVLVFDPDGTHLGTRNTGVATGNCGGGDDGSVLSITADMYLCRIRLTTRGY